MELKTEPVSRRSLRERHKDATKKELRSAALTLFERNGYSQTSVDEIAAAAGVSRSTFFRYFHSKEEVLAIDNRQNALLFLQLLEDRPGSEGRLEALEEALIDFSHAQQTDQRREEFQRLERIVTADPTLSAARAALTAKWREEVAHVLARRDGRSEPDLEDALASAVLSQMTEQIGMRWRTADTTVGTTDLIRASFAALRHLITN